ncbi:SDR family oxidoreductase [Pseudohoeflea suaedae]|uniref:SDR family oxidoreductase n=1 Tax=Pseudohoeflea suaedae TaxID=877384 RepID=A0A4R5PQF0_9HYPH|nr:SDR family oxidoreductase [Pseudohoeflea suaedae]TDH38911.1 SDR family oxidoreductase [Pseudohoeflea suaedae]
MVTEDTSTIALVTGAGKRIGRAIALDLAVHGFKVAVHANTSKHDAEETASMIRDAGGKAEVFLGDLTKADVPAKLMAAVTESLGAPRLVINNASIFEADFADEFDGELFDRHMAVHVKAPALLAASMAKALAKDVDGLVVNMIDQRVKRLTPNFFSYTLSKSALWTATRTMAMAYAPKIRVNAIGPGPTLKSSRQSDAEFARQVEKVPLERSPELGEFGATIRYFWANKSITGQMIALDGGQHLAWETPDVLDIEE